MERKSGPSMKFMSIGNLLGTLSDMHNLFKGSHLITSLSVLCEPHDSIRKPHPIANGTESLVQENSVE